MDIKRKKFQGVINILSFNRHFYISGFIVWGLTAIYSNLFGLSSLNFWVITAAIIYGLIMPLIVSAYVYDFSGYYDFDWLNKIGLTETKPEQIVNINAGFDETSYILKSKFPNADLKVYDFYNAKLHTEPAIVRARKISSVYPNTQHIKADQIPMDDKSVDLVFLLSSAHEIRSHKEKVLFLKECHRICKPNGKVITVEHLRDAPNFLAFSIGFTHFFSRNAWEKAFKDSGFSSFDETKFTSVMSIFISKP